MEVYSSRESESRRVKREGGPRKKRENWVEEEKGGGGFWYTVCLFCVLATVRECWTR
jgi:hypothetical protein